VPARVTAIVLNYDGRELLDVMLPSLLAQDYEDVRVVLVDNGSRDGSPAHVRERWPAVEVLEIPDNIGVAAALNRGAEATDGEYVALLNNDLELLPGWLGALVCCLDEHPRAATATGKMLSYHRRDHLDGAGDLFMWSGAATHRGFGERDEGQYDAVGPVFSPCAGAALYRRAAFEAVGPFDEDFFAYLEDIDWGLRAQLAGFESRYEPAAVCFHHGGATTGQRRRYYDRLQRRNQILLVIKDYPGRALLRHGTKVLLHQAGWIVAAYRDGALREQLASVADAARLAPRMLAKRRDVQRRRRASLAQLDRIVTPEPYAGVGAAERMRGIAGGLAAAVRGRGG
jgi:GT2 family glycosyltransferase